MFDPKKPYQYRNGERALILSTEMSELYPICSVERYYHGAEIRTHDKDGYINSEWGKNLWDLVNVTNEVRIDWSKPVRLINCKSPLRVLCTDRKSNLGLTIMCLTPRLNHDQVLFFKKNGSDILGDDVIVENYDPEENSADKEMLKNARKIIHAALDAACGMPVDWTKPVRLIREKIPVIVTRTDINNEMPVLCFYKDQDDGQEYALYLTLRGHGSHNCIGIQQIVENYDPNESEK